MSLEKACIDGESKNWCLYTRRRGSGGLHTQINGPPLRERGQFVRGRLSTWNVQPRKMVRIEISSFPSQTYSRSIQIHGVKAVIVVT